MLGVGVCRLVIGRPLECGPVRSARHHLGKRARLVVLVGALPHDVHVEARALVGMWPALALPLHDFRAPHDLGLRKLSLEAGAVLLQDLELYLGEVVVRDAGLRAPAYEADADGDVVEPRRMVADGVNRPDEMASACSVDDEVVADFQQPLPPPLPSQMLDWPHHGRRRVAVVDHQ